MIYSTMLIYAIYYLSKCEKNITFFTFNNVQNILTVFFYIGHTKVEC